MNEELRRVVEDARRWIEQERAWGEDVFASSPAGERRVKDAGKSVEPSPGPRPLPFASRPAPVRPISSSSPRPVSIPPRASSAEASRKAATLKALYEKYEGCTRCPLGFTRLKFVFGVGDPAAPVLFIGEGPGYEEDHRGEPFVGRAGQLLDKMLEAIGLSRKGVYIANIVKCHAMVNPQTPHERGNDRAPTTLEAEACSPILQQQIAIIQPRVIVTLGSPATRALLGTMEGITKIRGRYFLLPMAYFKRQSGEADLFEKKSEDDFAGLTPEQLSPLATIQVLPMYHPAALLRNPNLKKDAWEDMKFLRDTLVKKPA